MDGVRCVNGAAAIHVAANTQTDFIGVEFVLVMQVDA